MRKGAGRDFPSRPEVQGYNASVELLKNSRRFHVALSRISQNQIRVLATVKGRELRGGQMRAIFCSVLLNNPASLVAEFLVKS